MKRLEGPEFDPHRVPIPKVMLRLNPGTKEDERNGAFLFVREETTDKEPLCVIASSGGGWDHVSVSTPSRCPTWEEMEWIKRRFFKESETAMQLHVTPRAHVNVHPYTLHLWRPLKAAIPLPPLEYV